MDMFISGRKHKTSYFRLLEYGVFKFYGENIMFSQDFTLKCTLKNTAH